MDIEKLGKRLSMNPKFLKKRFVHKDRPNYYIKDIVSYTIYTYDNINSISIETSVDTHMFPLDDIFIFDYTSFGLYVGDVALVLDTKINITTVCTVVYCDGRNVHVLRGISDTFTPDDILDDNERYKVHCIGNVIDNKKLIEFAI